MTLPPLPKSRTLSRGDEDGPLQLGYTADQMRTYAEQTVAAERERLRAALTKVVDTYDAYRRRGVVPSPVEYADVIVAIEQARAALKEKP